MTLRKILTIIFTVLMLFSLYMTNFFSQPTASLALILVFFFSYWLFYTSLVLLLGIFFKPLISSLLLFSLFFIQYFNWITLYPAAVILPIVVMGAYLTAIYFMSRTIKKNLTDKPVKFSLFYPKVPSSYGIMTAIRIGLNISTLPLLIFILFLFFITISL